MDSRRDPVVEDIRRTRTKISGRLAKAMRSGRFEDELRKMGREAKTAMANGNSRGAQLPKKRKARR